MYSDLNFAPPKVVKAVFGLTDKEFRDLVISGQLKVIKRYVNLLVRMENVASFYKDRDGIVLKRWGYDYEDPKDKYYKMVDTQLKGFPRCFFRVNDIPDAYYRAFHKGKDLKVCVYVFDGFARCVCYSREHEEELMMLFKAYEEGRIEVEG